MLDYEWNEHNLAHIARHGVTAAEAEYVLEHRTLDLGVQDETGEERFVEAGSTAAGRILMVVTTWRGFRIRVVTAFDAPRNVVAEYHRTR